MLGSDLKGSADFPENQEGGTQSRESFFRGLIFGPITLNRRPADTAQFKVGTSCARLWGVGTTLTVVLGGCLLPSSSKPNIGTVS